MDSKYTLVHLAARRAREINSYYHSLGEGLGQYTPPLVEQVDSNKPLSIALEEIAQEKIVPQHPGDAQRLAEEMLGSDLAAAQDDAEVVALDGAEDGAAEGDEAAGGPTDDAGGDEA